MWLGSCIAVAVVGDCSSDSTPSLGTSICPRCGPKKGKKRKKKETNVFKRMTSLEFPSWHSD